MSTHAAPLIDGDAALLPAMRIFVCNPSSCLPGGIVPPNLKTLFVDSKRSSIAIYSGSPLPKTELQKQIFEHEFQLLGSNKITWTAPVMPTSCTADQLQRWWTSGTASSEFLSLENVQLKAQIEALCSGNINNLERERQQADLFADVVARRVFGIPECVAYAQLDVECGFLLPAKDTIYFADVCGIGAFTEFVITRKGKAAKGWIIRSAGDETFSPARMNQIARSIIPTQVDVKYAPSDVDCRSLTQESVRLEIMDHVLAVTGDGLDIVAAAWAPDYVKDNARSVGNVCARFVAQVLTAFDLCAQGGTLLVRVFTSTDPVVLGLLPLVASCFEASAILKPLAISPYSAVRFLVCKGMIQRISESSGLRPATSAFLAAAIKKLESGDPAWLAGPSPLHTPPSASKFVVQANDSIDVMVSHMWARAAALKSGGCALNTEQNSSKLRSQLAMKLSAWAVPDKSLLQEKNELQKLGFTPTEIESFAAPARIAGFMNPARMAQLQTNKAPVHRPLEMPQNFTQTKVLVPPPKLNGALTVNEDSSQRSPSVATPVCQAPKSHASALSASSSSVSASKKKRSDAEFFLEANELDGTGSSALKSSSKEVPSSTSIKSAVPTRMQTSPSSSASTSGTAPKVIATPIPAPLLAAAKKAGMSVATSSSKSAKAPYASPPHTVFVEELSLSKASHSDCTIKSNSPQKMAQVSSDLPVTASISATSHFNSALPSESATRKVTAHAVRTDNGDLSSSSKAAIPIRRRRIVDSDDSDDAPAAPASLPSFTAAPSPSGVISTASDTPSKKPRISISSSRVKMAATVDAAETIEVIPSRTTQVEVLVASETSVSAAAAPAAAVAAGSETASSKSGLKFALKRRISD